MQGNSNSTPGSSRDTVVLDVKPLRSLTPMFPAPFGHTVYSAPDAAVPLVYVSPSVPVSEASLPAGFSSHPSVPATAPAPATRSSGRGVSKVVNGSMSATPAKPLRAAMAVSSPEDGTPLFSVQTSTSGRKIKTPSHLGSYKVGSSGTEGSDKKVSRKRAKKAQNNELMLLPGASLLDPREVVESILITFDALRRRHLQMDEAKDVNRRPDLRASAIMMSNDLRTNKGKRIGSVPGIEVGDIFYFRMELCVVGLHAPSMGGIDYMTATFGAEQDPVAISVVSAGAYENQDEDVDILIYSGSGGISKFDKKPTDDQKLERGNLALERSVHRGNLIRVIRSVKDLSCATGKIYIYDGLYKIHESWVEKAKSGFNVFKYKFVREPGQPDGIAIWKMTEKWKENPSSRGRVILPDISSGVENIPVCLFNDVDNEKGPSLFHYVTKVNYLQPISLMKPLEGCTCLSVCLPGDINCSCAKQNEGDLPYSSSGLLVSRKPMIYECNTSCQCSVNCRNKVTQKGVRLHFEVFRTRDKGWGLRSWDPIRAGTFISEYTGEVIDRINVHDDGEEDEYIFQATYVDEKTRKWNYLPELLGEPSIDTSVEAFKTLPIIITAKNMGNISRFMNHSCSPNVFWQPVQHDHNDEGFPHIMFFALKHIPPMMELTYDYGVCENTFNSACQVGFRRPKKCFCGSPKCRGYFG